MLNSKIITLVLALTAVTLAVPAHAQNAFAVEQDREVVMQRQWQMQADINELLERQGQVRQVPAPQRGAFGPRSGAMPFMGGGFNGQ
jgi:hypothetical protein